jgi:hypothetical protein
MLAQTHSQRLHTELRLPSTIPEAINLDQIARETANLLWNMVENAKSALASEISDLSATFHRQFLAQNDNPRLRSLIRFTQDRLSQAFKEAIDISSKKKNPQSLLRPCNTVHSMTLTLVNSQPTFDIAASVLTVDSLDENQWCGLVWLYGQLIDVKLRSVSGKVSDTERQQFPDLFELFAMGILSLTAWSKTLTTRGKLLEIWSLLMGALCDLRMTDDARQKRSVYMRNLLIPLPTINDNSIIDDLVTDVIDCSRQVPDFSKLGISWIDLAQVQLFFNTESFPLQKHRLVRMCDLFKRDGSLLDLGYRVQSEV